MRNCYTYLTLILLGLSGYSLPAQVTVPAGQQAVTFYQQGEEALLQHDYKKAVRLFERALDLNPDLTAAHRAIGACYELLNQPADALDSYLKVLSRDSLFSRALYYDVGELLYKTGRPEEALTYFYQYENLQKRNLGNFGPSAQAEAEREEELRGRLYGNIRACHVSMDSLEFLNVTEVANLGGAINTKADEYFPFLSNDQNLLLYTRRRNEESDEDLYYSAYENGRWQGGSPVGSPFNTNENEGMTSMVRDGRRLYFTACQREGVLGGCDIWEALVNGTNITNIQALEGFANSPGWESQACISCDGSRLYFASRRDGGRGKSDLYYSDRQPDGSWEPPVNLGSKVNTPYDEEAPFITNDGQTLYFSSTGHLGMGEQDIFMTWLDANGNWSTPINLGPPVNTAYRELGFFLSADGQTGFFASNRPEGKGGMDIYSFQLSRQLYSEPVTFVEGYVRDSILRTPLSALVDFKDRDDVTTETDGRFFLCVRGSETLDITVEKKGFHPYRFRFPVPKWDNRTFYTIEVLLQPTITFIPPDPPQDELTAKGLKEKKDTILEARRPTFKTQFHHDVFFEFDKSIVDLGELFAFNQFLQQFAGKEIIRVEIIGYADDIGTDVYNLRLSEERAKNIALLLMENDIVVDRIYVEGRGEVRDDSPKAKNRRVEIRVVTQETK